MIEEKFDLAFTGLAEELAKYQPTEEEEANVNLDTYERFPSLSFFHSNMPIADKIKEQHKNIKDGDPFIRIGDMFIRPGRYIAFVARSHEYWAQTDSENRITAVTFENPGRDRQWKQNVLSELLIHDPQLVKVIGVSMLPTVTNFRTTKVQGIKTLISMMRDTKEKAWLKEKPLHEALVQNGIPPFLRVAAEFSLKAQVSTSGEGKGRTYHKLEAASVDGDALLVGLKAYTEYNNKIKAREKEIADLVAKAEKSELSEKEQERHDALVADPVPTMDKMRENYDARLDWLKKTAAEGQAKKAG